MKHEVTFSLMFLLLITQWSQDSSFLCGCYSREEWLLQWQLIARHCHFNHALQWLHNERNAISNHQPFHCLLSRLFRGRSKKTSKLHITGLCAGNSPVTGEFPAQMASNAENVSIWWCHHVKNKGIWGHNGLTSRCWLGQLCGLLRVGLEVYLTKSGKY